MIISNSTPLIYLAKLNKLDLAIKIYKKIIIPQEVYNEVVLEGKKFNKKEVFLIENFINDKLIEIKEGGELKKEMENIHIGEAKAINLCIKSQNKEILIDDKEAYEICKLLNLKPVRTTAFLLYCVKKNLISKYEFKELLIKLSKEGYFLSIEVFEFLLSEVEKIN